MKKTSFLLLLFLLNGNLFGQNSIIEFAKKRSTIVTMIEGLKGIVVDAGIDANYNKYESYIIPKGDSLYNISNIILNYDKENMVRSLTIFLHNPVNYNDGLNESKINLIDGNPTIYKFSLSGNPVRLEFYYESSTEFYRTLYVIEKYKDIRTGATIDIIAGYGWTVNIDESCKSINPSYVPKSSSQKK